MALQIYNSLTRQTEEFTPQTPGRVSMYVCGPTVYSDAHIGHAMAAIIFDMVRRYLIYTGYKVKYATNFTDVDDKIIRRANEQGRDPRELADHYAAEYLRHLRELNVMEADVYPRVSATIPQIVEMIQGLGEGGYTYELNGDVYFRVHKDEDYGKLSGRKMEEALSGTRVAEDERKEHPGDFALWKSAKPGEIFWESPWGKGRPGWHIECSAMCLHHLGETIDIHGGGNDLVFPHHENEIAQSESLTGKPLARYWMHNGMLQLSGEKMSKSLGNLITIDQFLQDHSADALRLVIFTAHYRKPVMFTNDVVNAAEKSLARLRTGLRPAEGALTTGDAPDALRQAAENARAAFIEAMDSDFNSASALATLFELVKAISAARSAGVSGPFYVAAQSTLRELAGVLGLTLAVHEEEKKAGSDSVAAKPFIDLLVSIRTDLRAAKQWALADKVRNELKALNVLLEDSPAGSTWRYEEQNGN